MGIRRIAVAVSAVAALAVASTAAAAPTVTISVSGFADSNSGTCHPTSSTSLSCTTLREAIINADDYESASQTAVIALSAGTYSLNGSIDIDYGFTITGAGMGGAPSGTTIAQTDGVSNVLETNTINTGTVTLEDLKITGGHYTSGYGGAINQNGDLDLNSVLVTANTDAPSAPTGTNDAGNFGSGGAILEQHGTLTLNGSSVSDNVDQGAPGTGGTSGTAGNGGYAYGGGISMTNDSSLIATNSHIDDNHAIGGAGGGSTGAGTTGGVGGQGIGGGFLMSSTGSVELTDTTVSGNSATGAVGGGGGTGGAGGLAYGGGLVMNAPGIVALTGVSMIGNTAAGGVGGAGTTDGVSEAAVGGAINSGSGSFDIHSSTLADNTAVGGASAGASGHAAYASGGAIDLTTVLGIVNSTIYGNQANAGSAAAGGSAAGSYGGALDIGGSNVTDVLDNDTFSNNSSTGAGGAQTQGGNLAFGPGTNAHMYVANTIFADGGATQPGVQNCELNPPTTALVDDGHNVEDETTSQCGLSSANHDVLVASGTPVVAAALAADGGPTSTLALVAGSPALNAGGACTDQTLAGATISVDQRGLPRPASPTTCDIGAFQHQPIGGTLHATIAGKPALHQTLTCSATGATGDVSSPSFVWLRNGAPIARATGVGYVVAAADEGHSLACRASVAGIYGGSLVATSAAVKVAAPTPAISGFSQSHSSWTEGSAKAHLSAADKKKREAVGTVFRFKLNVAAAVTFTFTHSATGRRSGKRCVAQTKHSRTNKRCALAVTDGTLKFKPAAGAHSLAFDGHLASGKKLAPGKHTVTLSATAGGKSAKPAKLSFTILRG